MVRIQRMRDTGNWTQVSTCSKPSDSILNHLMERVAKQKMNGYTGRVRAIDDSGNLINFYSA
jgi:hypothetical protein